MEAEWIRENKLLYDDVRQLLYSFMLGFQYSELNNQDPEIIKYYAELKEWTSNLFEEIKTSASRSDHLHLTSCGFLPAIRRWVKRLGEQYAIRVILESIGIEKDERWSEEQETTMYFFCRYWIFQTLRHMASHYDELTLTITGKANELRLFFKTPANATDGDWWCTYLLQNPYLWRDMDKYGCTVQFNVQESGVYIIATFRQTEDLSLKEFPNADQ